MSTVTTLHTENALEVRIAPASRNLELKTYTQILGEVRLALEEVDRVAIPVRAPRIRWAIDDLSMDREVRITLVPASVPQKREPGTVSQPLRGFVEGVGALSAEALIPPFFSEQTVNRVNHIGRHLGSGEVESVALTSLNGKKHSAVMDEATVFNAAEAVKAVKSAHSSVVGIIDVLSHGQHRAPRALIRDARTRHAIRVRAQHEQSDLLRNAWGKKVLASGLLERNYAGQAVVLDLSDLEILPEGKKPMDPMRILGVDAGFTGELSTEEFMRRVRSA